MKRGQSCRKKVHYCVVPHNREGRDLFSGLPCFQNSGAGAEPPGAGCVAGEQPSCLPVPERERSRPSGCGRSAERHGSRRAGTDGRAGEKTALSVARGAFRPGMASGSGAARRWIRSAGKRRYLFPCTTCRRWACYP